MEDTKIKTLQITIHCLPREIDQLERLCNSLRESYFFTESEINIILDVTLNLNEYFVDWSNSKIPKQFFIDKFNNIDKFNDWTYRNVFDISEDSKCLGINDKRRNSINDSLNADFLMYLDLDVYFPNLSFIPLVQLLDQIKNEYSIISLETVRLWDNTWDGLTNKKYIHKDHEFFKNLDPYRVNKIAFDNLVDNEFNIRTINPIKFGGGWFNIFSKNLLKFINIPDSLGSYGLDDTFIMMASNYMLQKGYDISQYVLEGLVCIENNRYTLYDYNPYKNFLEDKSFSNKGRDFKKHSKEKSHININNELQKFINKI
jgi:hypothetical protein